MTSNKLLRNNEIIRFIKKSRDNVAYSYLDAIFREAGNIDKMTNESMIHPIETLGD